MSFDKHVSDLLGHIDAVQKHARTLAYHLAMKGEEEFARHLLSKAHVHDASKWEGVEWKYLHQGPDVSTERLKEAIAQHQQTNDHHPEHWGGLRNMPPVCVAEMICDWVARSQEFCKDIKEFVETVAPSRFDFESAPAQVKLIKEYLEVLLPKKFKAGVR